MSDLREATAVELLKHLMTVGIAHFVYTRKSDGKEREAFGTTKAEIIPKYDAKKVESLIASGTSALDTVKSGLENPESFAIDPDGFKGVIALFEGSLKPFWPKGSTDSAREPNPNIVTYYDLESQGWRSFGVENLVMLK